jgi:hypothetical protein
MIPSHTLWGGLILCISLIIAGCASRKTALSLDPIFDTYGAQKGRNVQLTVEAKRLVFKGRRSIKNQQIDEAISYFQAAQKVLADEDHLVLIAATYEKSARKCFDYISNKERGGASCPKKAQTRSLNLCKSALNAWQRYLSGCTRCRRPSRLNYRKRGIESANALGARCGSWIDWESAPSRAQLSIDGHRYGQTPQGIWLAEGRYIYELTLGHLGRRGELLVRPQEVRKLQLPLKSQDHKTAWEIKSTLRCTRPPVGASEANGSIKTTQPDRCVNRLRAGDLFSVELRSTLDTHLYLLSRSRGETTLIFPEGEGTNQLRPLTRYTLPTLDQYRLDDSGADDALTLIFSLQPLPELEALRPRALSPLTETERLQVEALLKRSTVPPPEPPVDQVTTSTSAQLIALTYTLRDPREIQKRELKVKEDK